jgi:hypothetical protein
MSLPPDLPRDERHQLDVPRRHAIHAPLQAVETRVDLSALVRQIARVRLIRAQLAHEAMILKGLIRISRREA